MIAIAIANIIGFIGIFFLIKHLRNNMVINQENRINIGLAGLLLSISLAIHGVLNMTLAILVLSLASAIGAYISFNQNVRKEELEKKEVIKWEKK